MRTRAVMIALALCISFLPSAQGGLLEQLDDAGSVFGGVHITANESGNASSTLSELPTIVEDYTATWCQNCVYVEHALNEVEENTSMQQYHFHRFIGESEDPFGTQEGDDRWTDRYDERLAPTVVFNGTIRQIGSTPVGDSLVEDFTTNVEQELDLGQGSSSLGWIPASNESNATVTWNLVIDQSLIPENGSIKSMIWVIEQTGHFAEGGNGEEDYPHIVRAVIGLGDALTGSMEITIPEAWDDDDLEIHLIHEMVLPEPEPDPEPVPVISDNPNSDGLPALGFLAVLSAIGMAAITVQRKQQ
jgi:hypothetical protein